MPCLGNTSGAQHFKIEQKNTHMAQVQIKPIERVRWHGKTSKEFPNRPVKISAFVDPSTGRYATGLTQEDRLRLEALTGFDLSDIYVNGRPHPFWSSKAGTVVLEDTTNILNSSNPIEEIKIKLLKASHFVAKSFAEYEQGLAPYAKFVIFDEQEEIEEKAAKSAALKRVYSLSEKLTPAKKADIVMIILGVSVKKQSAEYIEVKFDEALEQVGPHKMLELLSEDPKRSAIHSIVLDALDRGILRREGSSIYYMDAHVSFDIEGAVDYFINKDNQTMKATILEKLN